MLIVKVLDIPNKLPKYELPSNILKHCNLYRDDLAKRSSLFAWINLSKYINLSHVTFNKNGKPISKDKGVYFSLSHSLNKVAIAISDLPVGIDIEALLPLNICRTLAQRLLENDNLKKYLNAKDREMWFTKYWTQHEAYIKLIGDTINFKNLKKELSGNVKTKIIRSNKNVYFVSIIQKK